MLDVRCWRFDVGCWMLDFGCWMLDVRCSMFDVRCSMFDVGCSMFDVGCWMLDVRCSSPRAVRVCFSVLATTVPFPYSHRQITPMNKAIRLKLFLMMVLEF